MAEVHRTEVRRASGASRPTSRPRLRAPPCVPTSSRVRASASGPSPIGGRTRRRPRWSRRSPSSVRSSPKGSISLCPSVPMQSDAPAAASPSAGRMPSPRSRSVSGQAQTLERPRSGISCGARCTACTAVKRASSRPSSCEELDRAAPVLGEAGLDLAWLLGDVHVHRAGPGAGHGLEPRARDRAHAVRRGAHRDQRDRRARAARAPRLAARKWSGGNRKSGRWRRLGRRVEARPRVPDAEQVDAQPHLAGSGDDPEGQLERVRVRLATGRVVEVVELAHGGDARARHLQEAVARGDGEAVRVERLGHPVHRLPPGPEVVLGATGGGCLRAATQEALKGVAVRVHEPGKEQLARKAVDRGTRWGCARGLAGAVRRDGEGHTAHETAAPHEGLGLEPAGNHGPGHPSNALVAGARGRA